MRILLLSTYELGHQPLHVASPAAELQAAGHEVVALDLAVDAWDPGCLDGVDGVAVSVPMHTALRLAVEAAAQVRQARPEMPIALYGLYAGVGEEHTAAVADRFIGGEYEGALVEWAASLAGKPAVGVSVDIRPRKFRVPARQVLAPLDRYAYLDTAGGPRRAGYVEASHGCRHRCRHCPIPAVYDGRFRITGPEVVLADIGQQVEAGAAHVTFGDPDFLNAPAYSMDVLEEAHRRFPELTFDVTVKVEHILARRDLLGRMAAAGVIFMVSAIECLDDSILARLAKDHTAADAEEAVRLVSAAGMDVHPTWLPFTPWTTPETVADIASFVWRHDLAAVTDPVQLSIRLLIPDGSLMLEIDDLSLTGYDPSALGYTWEAADPAMDALQAELGAMAESGGPDRVATLAEMTGVIATAAGVVIETPAPTGSEPPRLSEAWFCCAEPTMVQLGALGGGGGR